MPKQRTTLLSAAAVLALAAALSAAPAAAQPSGGTAEGRAAGTMSGSTNKVARADRNAMRDMAHSNLAEIATGRLALEKSQNDMVKQFAQKMVDDHSTAQKDVEQLAQAKGVELPTEPDAKHKATATALKALSADAFDKQYMSQAGLGDHRRTLELLQKTQKNAKDADLKALAAKTEPVVRQHLMHAEQMAKK